MTANAKANLLVFRETKQHIQTQELIQELSARIVVRLESRQSVVDALIRAGELECALLDSSLADANIVAALTDLLAAQLIRPDGSKFTEIAAFSDQFHHLQIPATVQVSPPEGFAYYALHPSDIADFASRWVSQTPAAVVGIRSIGTTLSAIFAAALNVRGVSANRTTVRPNGHPYNRHTDFSPEQLQWIRKAHQRSCRFIVVDEGPGLSGSSFLSVGEALVAEGIPGHRITMIGTRNPDPATLYARNGADRWNCFRHETFCSYFYSQIPQRMSLNGGAWRESLLGSGRPWPACWPQMERIKFLSPDGRQILKFDGLGRYGQKVRDRADCLFQAGLGPSVEDGGDGLTASLFISGQPLARSDLSISVIERMARYCAKRASLFKTSDTSPLPILNMVRHNLQQQLDLLWEPEAEALDGSRSVIADGHMQPEEWICTAEGSLIKVDGCTHGEDHFFPGPVDVAWDLAGAIVEWDMSPQSRKLLVDCFHRLTGDDPERRLRTFVSAYAVFRLAYSKMAQLALRNSTEEPRWQRAYQSYLRRVISELRGVEKPSTK
jgi:hypothetical protein